MEEGARKGRKMKGQFTTYISSPTRGGLTHSNQSLSSKLQALRCWVGLIDIGHSHDWGSDMHTSGSYSDSEQIDDAMEGHEPT